MKPKTKRTLFFRNSLTFLSSVLCLSSVVTVAERPVFSLTAASSLASTFFRFSSTASKRRSCSPRCWTRDLIWKGFKDQVSDSIHYVMFGYFNLITLSHEADAEDGEYLLLQEFLLFPLQALAVPLFLHTWPFSLCFHRSKQGVVCWRIRLQQSRYHKYYKSTRKPTRASTDIVLRTGEIRAFLEGDGVGGRAPAANVKKTF